MKEFMQMMEELFRQLAGKNGKGEGGDENQDGNPEAPGRMPRIKVSTRRTHDTGFSQRCLTTENYWFSLAAFQLCGSNSANRR